MTAHMQTPTPQRLRTEQKTFETERFTLRPLRKSDQGLIELYASDMRVAGPTRSIPHPMPPGATEAFIKTCMADARTEDVWAIDGTKSNLSELIGVIALECLERNQAKIGYWLGSGFWGKGFGQESVRALIDANPLESDTVFAEVFQDNPASARVLTNCGFSYIGDAESYCLARNKTISTWTYSRKM